MDGFEVLERIRRGAQRARREGRVPVAVVIGEEAYAAVVDALRWMPKLAVSPTAARETIYGLTVRRDADRPWAIDVETDPLSPTWIHPARRAR